MTNFFYPWSHPMRTVLTVVLLGLLFTAACGRVHAKPPNVVVILADDQGWGDLSLTGNPNFQTPHIDSIARDGARLDSFYVCAVCSPTRAEFLTGRYHTRMGVYSTSSGGERFNADEITIADVFRHAGYKTAAYGKWHSGMQAPHHPNTRGFDDYYGFCSGHWGNYFSPMLEHNGELVTGNGFIIDDFTDHAIRFIESAGPQPFFVYLPYNTPHSPMQAPEKYWDAYKDRPIIPDPDPQNAKQEDKDFTRAALAMVANIDDNVGRVLACLDRQNIADDTIVVYFSDNGPNKARYNAGMRGRKGSVFEGGLRSPCVIRYPAQIDAGTQTDTVGGGIDLMPTLLDLAGIDTSARQDFAEKQDDKTAHPIDGRSLAGVLTGTAESPGDERLLFSTWRDKASVRSDRYRYHHTGELFDILADQEEDNDVAGQFPGVAAELASALQQWQSATPASNSVPPETRPFVLGHPAMRQTQLPARDAEAGGNIRRSNRFPNCTYFLNWTDTDDAITWDVDVHTAGQYDVQMLYACPTSSVGTKLRLTAGKAATTTTVDTPNDVPILGADDDLFPRQEGYVKDWATMSLGTIDLATGPQTVKLSAVEIPGDQAVEMRLLMFVRRSAKD